MNTRPKQLNFLFFAFKKTILYCDTRAKQAFLWVIKFYQVFISPGLGKNCRFFPNCSKYAGQAVKKYGLVKGCQKGLWRILKCHPWTIGGIDLP